MKRQKSAAFAKKKKEKMHISPLMTKTIAKLGTIAIIQVNTEVVHIAFVI